MDPARDHLSLLLATLHGKRIDCTTEDRMQADVARLLTSAGVHADREVILGPGDRIDLLAGEIGIECKIEGSTSSVARQIIRYLYHDRISGLLLVTGRARIGRPLPATMSVRGRAKPIAVHETWRGNL